MPLDPIREPQADKAEKEEEEDKQVVEEEEGDVEEKEPKHKEEEEVVVVSTESSSREEEVCLPQANTIKIFAPRTADMNKGFLTFDDDSGRTIMKEEPDDLTHLAPQAGDVCFPLDLSISYPDLMEDAFLSCSLDEGSSSISDLDSLHSSNCFPEVGCSSDDSDLSPPIEKSLKSPLTNDPFLCLREEEGFSSDYGIGGLSHRPLFKGPDKHLMGENRKSKDNLGSVDCSNTTCRAENLDVQDDCLSDCASYIPLDDVDDLMLNPASSLLLETALVADSQNFGELEECVPLPAGSTQSSLKKLLKRERMIILNAPSGSNMIKFTRNELQSDGSSEYLDEYDSDPLESDTNRVHFGRTSKLLVNPNNVFQSSVLKPQTRASQQNLFHKQSQVFERRRAEIVDPGDVILPDSNGFDQGSSSSSSAEQQHLSILDPPPKRNGPHLPQPLESPKKMRMDPRLVQSKGAPQGSVLLNLLVRGEDASHGYMCTASQGDHLKYKLLAEATVLEKPSNTQPKMSHTLSPADVRTTRRAHNLVL